MAASIQRLSLFAVFIVAAAGCGDNSGASTTATPPSPRAASAEPFVPPPIVVGTKLPVVKMDGTSAAIPLSSAASYAWNAMIAINWPASTAPNTRGVADAAKNFGDGTPAWMTMRSKVEVYPGNADATTAPHGVTLADGKPTNAPDYGYGEPPQYVYKNGLLGPCPGQQPVQNPALIVLDETTQIDNNQTFAGAAPATDPKGFNSKPQLIRYAVKMSATLYARAIEGRYWYWDKESPLATAQANYRSALAKGPDNPQKPFVNYAPVPPDGADMAGIEVKSAWRPLTAAEARSGRFVTAMVRYYEQPLGKSCYREAEWGLVGMHLISFSVDAPWVIWSTFEQVDNILTADGKRTEDENGNPLNQIVPEPTITTPRLSSDPDVAEPAVTANGPYCAQPGARLYFRENPKYRLPSGGNICVNRRWSNPEPQFITANAQAHKAISDYFSGKGKGSSPLMYYKLVGAQGIPVDETKNNDGLFSTTTSYYSANATIETDYSLGHFTGNLVEGVPANKEMKSGQLVPYINTRLLRFQSTELDFTKLQMGGCAGCHGYAAQIGLGFSFALGNNVTEPEWTDAFRRPNLERVYFPRR